MISTIATATHGYSLRSIHSSPKPNLNTNKPTTAVPGSRVTTPLHVAKAIPRKRTAAATSRVLGAEADNPRGSGKIKKYSSPNKLLLTLFMPKHILRLGDKNIPVFSSSVLKSRLRLKSSRFQAIRQMFDNSILDLLNEKLKNHEIEQWSYRVGLECSNGSI